MPDKKISQLAERATIVGGDVLPIVASGATETNKVSVTTIKDWLQQNMNLGITSVGISVNSTGSDISVSNSPITTAGSITISIPTASGTSRGALSASDWTLFNSKESALTFDSPLVRTTNAISITQSGSSTSGYLSSADWNTFNSKQGSITLTTNGTSGPATLVGTTLNIPNYTTDTSNLVPYAGATQNVNLGEKTITAYDVNVTDLSGNVLSSLTKDGVLGIGVVMLKSNNFYSWLQPTTVSSQRTWTLPDASGTIALTTDIPNLSGYVPTSRTLTINGVTQDLTTDRSWQTMPSGGTAGQILSKVDGTDFNTQWVSESPAASYTSVVKHRVKAGEAISKGQAVYVSSSDGTNMIVSKASNASEGTSSKTMGLLESSVSNNGFTNVITEGLLEGLNTNGANAGDPVWLGVGGDLIFGLPNKPVAPAHLVFIGIVTRVNANNGEIFVKVQNGFELHEIHDVLVGSYGTKDVLYRDTTTNLWKNASIQSVLGYTPSDDSNVVHITGTETITGTKTFSGALITANGYGVTIDGGTTYGAMINFKSTYGNVTARGYGYSSIGAIDTTKFLFYCPIDVPTNSKRFYFELSGLTTNVVRTYTMPDASGTLALLSDIPSLTDFVTLGTTQTITATKYFSAQQYFQTYPIITQSGIALDTRLSGTAASNHTTLCGNTNGLQINLQGGAYNNLNFADTANGYTYTFPAASGTIALTSDIPSLSGYVPTSRTITINGTAYDLSADRSWTIAAGVSSFNTRTGAITLTSADVTTALGYTPYNSSNPSGYITGITSTMVTNALGYTPYNSSNPSGYITSSSLTWANITGKPALATPRGEGSNYIDYARYVYNNGAYSGVGWTEPSDLGVRYALNSTNADYASNSGNTNSVSNATGNNYTWTGINYFRSNKGQNVYMSATNSAPLQAYSDDSGTAMMSFHRGGYYAINMGLDPDNVFRIGGWSASGNRLQMDMSGNLTMAGDITAFSDERVKENIKTIDNALDKVLALRGVSYTRKDSDDKKTKIGVIAQETLPIVPEVVNEDNDGMYSVAYGNFGGLFIEAFKEQQKKIEAQDKVIEELKKLIYANTK